MKKSCQNMVNYIEATIKGVLGKVYDRIIDLYDKVSNVNENYKEIMNGKE
jgi:hypothetical protein